jgi:hypothetical protein
MQIAIPSTGRSQIIQEKTLRMLKEYNVNPKDIYVFVAKNELAIYQKTLASYGCNVIEGKRGLRHQRNYISKFFPEHTKLICIDDDVNRLYILKNDCLELEILPDFKKTFNDVFNIMKEHSCYLGGIAPVKNPYFMKRTITFDLRFIVGAFWMCIVTKSPPQITMDEKEDVERTLKYYVADGALCRANHITLDTVFFQRNAKAPGGMQTSNHIDRKKAAAVSASKLKLQYPDLGRIEVKKSTGWPEFRLKRMKPIYDTISV